MIVWQERITSFLTWLYGLCRVSSTVHPCVSLNTETKQIPTARLYCFILSNHLFRSRKNQRRKYFSMWQDADIASVWLWILKPVIFWPPTVWSGIGKINTFGSEVNLKFGIKMFFCWGVVLLKQTQKCLMSGKKHSPRNAMLEHQVLLIKAEGKEG